MKNRDKNLEAQFREAVKIAQRRISQHLSAAEKELENAVKVSNEFGIPFSSNISFLAQNYCPSSFHHKWKWENIDLDELNEWLDVDVECLEGAGWEHSDVC